MKKPNNKCSYDQKSGKKKSWRTPNAFVLFQEAKREMIRTTFGTKKLQQVSKIASSLWQNASEEERGIYVQRSNELRNQKVMESVNGGNYNPDADKATSFKLEVAQDKKPKLNTVLEPISTNLDIFELVPSFGWTPTEAAFRPQFDQLMANNTSESFSNQTNMSVFSQMSEIDRIFYSDYMNGQELTLFLPFGEVFGKELE